MSIHVALHHRTHYAYDRLVTLGPQVVRLRPAPHCRTRILSYSLRVLPEPHFINWQQDPQSNYLARLVFPEKTREFCVEVDVVAEMSVLNPFDFFLEPDAEKFPFHYDPTLDHELEPFQLKGPLSPKFQAYLATVSREALGVHRIAFVLKNGLVFAMLLIALGVSTASLIFTDFEMTSNATQVFQTDNDPGVGAAIAWTFTAIKT